MGKADVVDFLVDAFVARENGYCPFCHNEINMAHFEDALSRKEFGMSGLCQNCQNSFFAEDDEG